MRHRSTIGILVLVGLASALDPGRALAAPPDDAISSQSYGRSWIWLERDPADRAKRRLVFEDAGAPPQVLDVKLPERNRRMRLTVGGKRRPRARRERATHRRAAKPARPVLVVSRPSAAAARAGDQR